MPRKKKEEQEVVPVEEHAVEIVPEEEPVEEPAPIQEPDEEWGPLHVDLVVNHGVLGIWKRKACCLSGECLRVQLIRLVLLIQL